MRRSIWAWIAIGSTPRCRPYLTQIRIGIEGIAFDRLDLDAFADDYKSRNGRPGAKAKGGNSSTSRSEATAAFAKALEVTTLKKRSATSPSAVRRSAKPASTE